MTGAEGLAGSLAVTIALWVWVMKAEVRGALAVGPARVVELTWGKDQDSVDEELVVGMTTIELEEVVSTGAADEVVRTTLEVSMELVLVLVAGALPGQLETVGLQEVMVTVKVMVAVEVMVLSAASWAATRERPVAKTVRMLLNCILKVCVCEGDVVVFCCKADELF